MSGASGADAKTRRAHTVRRLRSDSVERTEALAAELAVELEPGTTIGLVGGLGAGKTCFVRGLARGLGIDPGEVASPTFVYLVDYPGRQRLFHADLYRFADLGEEHLESALEGIGLLDAIASQAITAVEWWQHYRGPEPELLVVVEFSIENADDRAISLTFSRS
jgi:tRNA threonylcarbamoyladenosine biosynthesis protein TsaE